MKTTLLNTAKKFISSKNHDLLNEIFELNICQFSLTEKQLKNRGFTPANAKKLHSLFSFAMEYKFLCCEEITKVKSSQEIYKVVAPLIANSDTEKVALVLLNRANHIIDTQVISHGGVAGCIVDTKVVFSKALEYKASGIILAHNHPSGNLKPSRADLNITTKIKEGGKILDVILLDHLIVTRTGYTSLTDEGYM